MYLRHNSDYSTTLCFDYSSRHIFIFVLCIMCSIIFFSMCILVNEYNEINMEEKNKQIKEMKKRRKYTYSMDYKYIYDTDQYFPKIIQKKIKRRTPSSRPVVIHMDNSE